jgi:competence protein ComEC
MPRRTAPVIGRKLWRERGALALRRDGSGFVLESARAQGFDRPWAPRPTRSSVTAAPGAAAEAPAVPSSPRHDATPRPEDLQPDD